MMPHLDCKLGDVLLDVKNIDWIVKGINTISGDIYVERQSYGIHMRTITAKNASQWDTTNMVRIK